MRPSTREFLGLHEMTTRSFLVAIVAEYLGTAILILTTCGAIVTMNNGQPVPAVVAAFTSGMTVAMIIWITNHVSGAHINPSVTLSFFVTGHITLAKTICFMIMQILGSVSGAAVVWFIVPESWRGTLGTTIFSEEITLAQGFATEVLCAFMLLLGVFASSDRLRTDHGGSMALTIGLIVFIQSAWAGNLTGASMNPARTFGPALMSGIWNNHWVYWVAPSFGGVFAAALYQLMLTQKPSQLLQAVSCQDVTLQHVLDVNATKRRSKGQVVAIEGFIEARPQVDASE